MLTESFDLRSGGTPWDDKVWTLPEAEPLPTDGCDVAVIGAGITGAIIAERLSADGLSVVLLDRRPPAMGSTAASTAQVMWAMDVPLCLLAERLGAEEAARRWHRVYAAVDRFGERLRRLGLAEGGDECPTVYLEGPKLDAAGLAGEAALHSRHGLPSRFLAAAEVKSRFDIAPRAAIVSDDGLAIDPVRVAHGLLAMAKSRGAQLCYPVSAAAISEQAGGVSISLEDGRALRAGRVVLASGYERAPLFLPEVFTLLSTFVIATPPGTAPLWRERAMIWEAADPYLYLRADDEGRVIAGGEDVDSCDPLRRDELLPQKAGAIAAKLGKLLGGVQIDIDKTWAATFGSSPDGLPAIGLAANMKHTWLAAGFGGNGIAFSAMASEIISDAFSGHPDPDASCFDPYRF